MPSVLSVQSRVAYGHVGNAASVFPLQRLGIEAWALDTVAFSNHTGHGNGVARLLRRREIAELFEGIAALGVLPQIDAVLSGYLGDAATGPVLLDILERVRAANPHALFCCDPVIGDIDTGSYVTAGIAEFFRDRALALADIVTPNLFELEYLTGPALRPLAEAAEAAETYGRAALHRAADQPRRWSRTLQCWRRDRTAPGSSIRRTSRSCSTAAATSPPRCSWRICCSARACPRRWRSPLRRFSRYRDDGASWPL